MPITPKGGPCCTPIHTLAELAKFKVRGCAKVEAVFTFTVIAYNLIRIPKLLTPAEA